MMNAFFDFATELAHRTQDLVERLARENPTAKCFAVRTSTVHDDGDPRIDVTCWAFFELPDSSAAMAFVEQHAVEGAGWRWLAPDVHRARSMFLETLRKRATSKKSPFAQAMEAYAVYSKRASR